MKRSLLLGLAALSAAAQAPLLQDGAAALRQARLEALAGEEPLPPSPLPFLEVGLGGAEGDGLRAPLMDGEGLGTGVHGWGLGLRGRASRAGWFVSATFLALRDGGRTRGLLQRGGLGWAGASGWRVALEQEPLAWGAGLLGGDLLGTGARPFPRLGFATPFLPVGPARWQAEAFVGRLTGDRPIPAWLPEEAARTVLAGQGLNLSRPDLLGARLRLRPHPLVEASLGALRLEGGRDGAGHPAPEGSDRSLALTELQVRLPPLARLLGARGLSLGVGRSGASEGQTLSLRGGRTLTTLQSVWEAWDLGFEYAGPSPRPDLDLAPSHLAGFSAQGDPLGPAFGPGVATRTLEVGMPFPWEGRARLRLVRSTAFLDHPEGEAGWQFQGDLQLRTPTGRAGLSAASRRAGFPGGQVRWGWSATIFHAFRVF